MFISKPFTGTRPDAFAQHAGSDGHGAYALSIQQSAERLVVSKQLEDIVAKGQVVSVDGEAFLDVMCCLQAVKLTLDALVAALESEAASEGNATALGLAMYHKFCSNTFFMSDFLSILGSLSTAFQT